MSRLTELEPWSFLQLWPTSAPRAYFMSATNVLDAVRILWSWSRLLIGDGPRSADLVHEGGVLGRNCGEDLAQRERRLVADVLEIRRRAGVVGGEGLFAGARPLFSGSPITALLRSVSRSSCGFARRRASMQRLGCVVTARSTGAL